MDCSVGNGQITDELRDSEVRDSQISQIIEGSIGICTDVTKVSPLGEIGVGCLSGMKQRQRKEAVKVDEENNPRKGTGAGTGEAS